MAFRSGVVPAAVHRVSCVRRAWSGGDTPTRTHVNSSTMRGWAAPKDATHRRMYCAWATRSCAHGLSAASTSASNAAALPPQGGEGAAAAAAEAAVSASSSAPKNVTSGTIMPGTVPRSALSQNWELVHCDGGSGSTTEAPALFASQCCFSFELAPARRAPAPPRSLVSSPSSMVGEPRRTAERRTHRRSDAARRAAVQESLPSIGSARGFQNRNSMEFFHPREIAEHFH